MDFIERRHFHRQDSEISEASREQIVNKIEVKQTVNKHVGVLEASHGKFYIVNKQLMVYSMGQALLS